MGNFMNRFLATSVFALAMSIVAVGVVWAGSAALRASNPFVSTTQTTSPDGGDNGENPGDPESPIDMPGIDPDDDIAELRRAVTELTAIVEDLRETLSKVGDDVDDLDQRTIEALEESKKASKAADDAATDAAAVKGTADEAKRVAEDAASVVSTVTARTSQLDDNGVYTGKLNPNQLSRKLTPTDLSGDWPLTRVVGDLRAEHLIINSFGCSSRYGYNTVMSIDPFRRVECLQIPK